MSDSGARREDRIEKLAEEIGRHAKVLDVTDSASVASFADWTETLGGASVLVNNAGGAKGLEPVGDGRGVLAVDVRDERVVRLDITSASSQLSRRTVRRKRGSTGSLYDPREEHDSPFHHRQRRGFQERGCQTTALRREPLAGTP
jgi:hypothetical protein